MPIEPPSSRWLMTVPPDDHPHDAWATGADLEPGTMLAAYRLGLFPMPGPDGRPTWWSPAARGVIPLNAFYSSRSLRRTRRRYAIRVDTAFPAVIRGCAEPSRPHGWIDDAFVAAYTRLHDLGWAHSVEAWDDEGLAGGLYGIEIGGLFAAESMFFRRRDASKSALLSLVETLRERDDGANRLLDVQWITPHLTSLGAVEITREEYCKRLVEALLLEPALAP